MSSGVSSECCEVSGRDHRRARCCRHAWIVLISAGPEIWLTDNHVPGTDVEVDPVVGISEPELDSIGVVALALSG